MLYKELKMGAWSQQQEIRKETKERDKTRKEKLAGYFFDLSKLSFAGLVVGIIYLYMLTFWMKTIGI